MNKETDEYQYQSLPGPDFIRILEIHPATQFDDPITGDLVAAPRDGDTPYAALSYSWAMNDGDASFSRAITIAGVRRLVTRNLFEALRRFRQSGEDGNSIWVDAICINQADDIEKGVQVARLADVYSKASVTIVWLGEDYEKDEAVPSMLHCLAVWEAEDEVHGLDDHTYMNEHGQVVSACVIRRPLPGSGSTRMRFPNYTGGKEIQQGDVTRFLEMEQKLRTFFQRRYWGRRWVLQELYQSEKDTIRVMWGPYRFPWTEFHSALRGYRKVVSKVSDIHSGYPRIYDEESVKSWLTYSVHLVDLQEVFKLKEKHWGGLLSWLEDCHTVGLQCSDPRDLIYSLLTMDPEFELKPDYTRTTAEVFTELASVMINKGSAGLVLGMLATSPTAILDPNPYALPSWVPNFTGRIFAPGQSIISFGRGVKNESIKIHERRLLEYPVRYMAEIAHSSASGEDGTDYPGLKIQSQDAIELGPTSGIRNVEVPWPGENALELALLEVNGNHELWECTSREGQRMFKAVQAHDMLCCVGNQEGNILTRYHPHSQPDWWIAQLLRKCQSSADSYQIVDTYVYNSWKVWGERDIPAQERKFWTQDRLYCKLGTEMTILVE